MTPDPPEPGLGEHLVENPMAEIVPAHGLACLVTEDPVGDCTSALSQGFLLPLDEQDLHGLSQWYAHVNPACLPVLGGGSGLPPGSAAPQ
jgi:hypothetical protein